MRFLSIQALQDFIRNFEKIGYKSNLSSLDFMNFRKISGYFISELRCILKIYEDLIYIFFMHDEDILFKIELKRS